MEEGGESEVKRFFFSYSSSSSERQQSGEFCFEGVAGCGDGGGFGASLRTGGGYRTTRARLSGLHLKRTQLLIFSLSLSLSLSCDSQLTEKYLFFIVFEG